MQQQSTFNMLFNKHQCFICTFLYTVNTEDRNLQDCFILCLCEQKYNLGHRNNKYCTGIFFLNRQSKHRNNTQTQYIIKKYKNNIVK